MEWLKKSIERRSKEASSNSGGDAEVHSSGGRKSSKKSYASILQEGLIQQMRKKVLWSSKTNSSLFGQQNLCVLGNKENINKLSTLWNTLAGASCMMLSHSILYFTK